MKLFVVVVSAIIAVMGATIQAPVDPELAALRALPALEHSEVRDTRGQYKLFYSTAEGTQVHETGRLVTTPDGKAQYLQIEGETRYFGTDGKLYITRYTAGLDGTHVEGDHIPVSNVAPPVPAVPQPVPIEAVPVEAVPVEPVPIEPVPVEYVPVETVIL